MKKFLLSIFLVFLLTISFGCTKPNFPAEADSVFVNEDFPSFEVSSTKAVSGEEDVKVEVSLRDNPDLLTMALKIEYDAKAMTLTGIESGESYSGYYFVGPKNKDSGCTASWFAPEIPENIGNGSLLKLHFNIKNNAKKRQYSIKISRPDNGGIVDENKNAIIVNNAIGYITIE